MFCTCGILLEDLLLHGPGTLENYSVVVIDEVHERSVESDLVLGIVKQHLLAAPKSRTRFVLMSATFDSKRYRDFFAPCLERGERLEIVAIPDHNTFLLGHIHNTRELYLDQAIKELQGAAGLAAWARALPDTFAAQATELLSSERIEPAGLALVARLVAQLHTTDADLSRHILVFLPTYRSMEDCYNHVSAAKLLGLEVHALHSSTDTRASNRAIEESAPGCRKLILATNVAESSLTIRNLAYVIDLCRSAMPLRPPLLSHQEQTPHRCIGGWPGSRNKPVGNDTHRLHSCWLA